MVPHHAKTRSVAGGLKVMKTTDSRLSGLSKRSPSPSIEQQSSFRKSPVNKHRSNHKYPSKYSPSKFAHSQKDHLTSKLKTHYRKYISEKHSRQPSEGTRKSETLHTRTYHDGSLTTKARYPTKKINLDLRKTTGPKLQIYKTLSLTFNPN